MRKLRSFYRDLFDWVTRSTEAGGFRYTTALVDARRSPVSGTRGGGFRVRFHRSGMSYVGVKNVDEAVSKAEKLGG